MTLVELLRRLRRHGVPGAALGPGVPADLRAEIAAELDPVFRALEPTVELTGRMRASAAEDAERMVGRAAEEAARIRRDAQRREADVAAAETRQQLDQVEADNRELMTDGEREAARITATAASRSPQLVERIIQVAMGLPGAGTGS